MTILPRLSGSLLTASLALVSCSVNATKLNDAVQVELSTNKAAIRSQNTIDKLSDHTQKMLEQYRSTVHQIETLTTYNNHLKNLLNSQTQEKDSLQHQLKEIETTQQEIVPLILRMLDNLDKFIALDLPFLPEERQQRLQKLKEMMVRADVTNAEKYRRILEAYQVENDYGNTIEAYRAELNVEGHISSVDFLRLGRVALYYQRLDGSKTGYWDKEQKKWLTLPDDYSGVIRNGLRVARKETAPDILTLPIPAAEAGQ